MNKCNQEGIDFPSERDGLKKKSAKQSNNCSQCFVYLKGKNISCFCFKT